MAVPAMAIQGRAKADQLMATADEIIALDRAFPAAAAEIRSFSRSCRKIILRMAKHQPFSRPSHAPCLHMDWNSLARLRALLESARSAYLELLFQIDQVLLPSLPSPLFLFRMRRRRMELLKSRRMIKVVFEQVQTSIRCLSGLNLEITRLQHTLSLALQEKDNFVFFVPSLKRGLQFYSSSRCQFQEQMTLLVYYMHNTV